MKSTTRVTPFLAVAVAATCLAGQAIAQLRITFEGDGLPVGLQYRM